MKRDKCRQKKNKHETQATKEFGEWCYDEEGLLLLLE